MYTSKSTSTLILTISCYDTFVITKLLILNFGCRLYVQFAKLFTDLIVPHFLGFQGCIIPVLLMIDKIPMDFISYGGTSSIQKLSCIHSI